MSVVHPPPGGIPIVIQPPSIIPTDLRHLRYGAPGCDDTKRSPDELRLIREMVSEEVDQFLALYNIDPAACREMRNEPPHLQLAIMERGTLAKAMNPSGSLVARIRETRRGIQGGPQGGGAGGGMNRFGGAPPGAPLDVNGSELDRFLAMNQIDHAAINSLRNESPEVQNAVMAKGPLVNTTNNSASLMARIRNVKNDIAARINPLLPRSQRGGPQPQGIPGTHPGMTAQPQMLLPPPNMMPMMPQPQQPLQIQDSLLMNDAMKAIQKLTSAPDDQRGLTAPTPGAPVPSGPGSIIDDASDKHLEDSGLRAIQAMQNEF